MEADHESSWQGCYGLVVTDSTGFTNSSLLQKQRGRLGLAPSLASMGLA